MLPAYLRGLVVVTLSAVLTFAEDSRPSATYRLTLCQPVYQSWDDFTFSLEVDYARYQTQFEIDYARRLQIPVIVREFELRDASGRLRLARWQDVAEPQPVGTPADWGRGTRSMRIDPADRWRLKGLGNGEYQIAILVNGVRGSNVASFKVDPALDLTKEPVLRLGMVESPPGSAESGLPLLWIVGPNPPEKEIDLYYIGKASLNCDGVKSTWSLGLRDGPMSPLESGRAAWRLMRVEKYQSATIKVRGSHAYSVEWGRHSSAIERFDLSATPLGTAWDQATSGVSWAPLPPPLLKGIVRDENGKPYGGVVVSVGKHRTVSDEKGRYSMNNIPAGEYAVSARAIPGFPVLGVGRDLLLSAGNVTQHDISFAGTYHIAGRVTEAGKGRAGIHVHVNWSDVPRSNAHCHTVAITDAEGRYEARGPYERVANVSIDEGHHLASSPLAVKTAKPGDKRVNFVVR